MRSSQQLEAPPFASLPLVSEGPRRIALPLHRVLGFARQDSESRPSRQLAFALRPLLGLALTTTGLCPELPAAPPRRQGPLQAAGHAVGDSAGDPETLISALSSLVEVVKLLTPAGGKVYARLGHEALAAPDVPAHIDCAQSRRGVAAAEPPRSQVVIELISTAGPDVAGLAPQVLKGLGSVAFELAVVAAIVEEKGGELFLGAPRGDSRSFAVRLPVRRT